MVCVMTLPKLASRPGQVEMPIPGPGPAPSPTRVSDTERMEGMALRAAWLRPSGACPPETPATRKGEGLGEGEVEGRGERWERETTTQTPPRWTWLRGWFPPQHLACRVLWQ